MRNRNLNICRLTAMLALGPAALLAQGVQTGDIQGTVRSKSGAPIAGALVRLDAGRGISSTTTNANGQYRFAHMLVGDIKITVSAKGYVGGTHASRINLGVTNDVDFVLNEMQQQGAIVEVVAATSQVDTAQVESGKNSSLAWVDDLPINNRSIQSVASLAPGTSNDANGMTIRGAQSTQTQYLVDGVDVMDPVTGGASIFMNEDMIEEIQVVSGGASADLGRFTGGMVNTVTKSGTNNWEGLARLEWTNPGVNAMTPMQGKLPMRNAIVQNYRFSGPIWKDHLFFVVGYRTTSPTSSTAYSTTAPSDWGGNQPYYYTVADERKDVKLDYILDNNNRFFWQYNETKRERANRDYADAFFGGSTSIATLSSQNDTFSYTSLGYIGTFSSNLILNAHYGYKKEQLGGPGSGGQGGATVPTYVDLNTQYVFLNGVFGQDPDSRPVKNATVSLTWFTDWMGQHEIKVGGDWFKSSRNSSNSQSPTNLYMYFDGFTSGPNNAPGAANATFANMVFDNSSYAQQWIPFTGASTHNTVMSYYINDKWKVNKNWALNLGLRSDNFKSVNDISANNFSFNALTPRLTVSWDPTGEASWVMDLSYDVYSGQVLQGATDGSSVVGNPAEYEYHYVSGPGNLLSSYDVQHPFLVYNPQSYRHSNLIDPNLKMPVMKELSYTIRHNDGSQGTYSLTISRREWSNFVNTFTSEQPNPVDANDLVQNVIKNDPSLVRHYFGIEFAWEKMLTEKWNFGGNLTISSLRGNFEGGQVGTAGSSEAYGPLGSYPNPPKVAGQTPAWPYQPTGAELDPYGKLKADLPLSLNVWTGYKMKVGPGTLNTSLMANYTSGAPYSLTATASLAGDPSTTGHTGYPNTNPGVYGATYTRYFGPRGALSYPDYYNCNLQVAYDVPIWSRVVGFVRANITNVFNHQQQLTWNTTGSAVVLDPAGSGNYVPDVWNSPKAKFLAGSSYGQAVNSTNFLAARALNVAFGVRF